MVSILIFNKGGTDVEDVLNDAVDTPEEGFVQHKNVKSIRDKGKLGHKWTHKRVDKASREIINKM